MGMILYRGPGVGVSASTPLLLDIYTGAGAAYSFRKLRSAYAGSAVKIRRSSDDAETDVGFSGNDFDSAAAASHIGGGSGFITKWYDQSGNGIDVGNGTASGQPLYVASGIGSKACLDFVSADWQSSVTDALTLNSANVSIAAVAYMRNTSDTYGRLVSFIANGAINDYDNTASAAMIIRNNNTQAVEGYRTGDTSTKSIVYDTPNVILSIWDSTNHIIYVDASAGTTVASSGTMGGASGGTLRLGQDALLTSWLGQCSEVVIWASDQTSSVSGIDSNIGTYYGL